MIYYHVNKLDINCLIFPIILFISILFSSCNPDEPEPKVFEKGSVKDIDGNIYPTVKIGSQWWMTKNLKVTRFRDGSPIRSAVDPLDWENSSQPSYCKYQNSELAPGLLYNFAVVSAEKNIAPEGYHIPSDVEWKQLEQFIGVQNSLLDKINWRGSTEGDKLKLGGSTAGWFIYEGLWGLDEFGFGAEAGSCRLNTGQYGIPGLKGSGFWWSSTPHNSSYSWYRYLDYKKSGIFRYYALNSSGYSIRCVKD